MPEIGQIRLLSIPTNNPIGVEVMKTTYAVILCVLLLLFSACAHENE